MPDPWWRGTGWVPLADAGAEALTFELLRRDVTVALLQGDGRLYVAPVGTPMPRLPQDSTDVWRLINVRAVTSERTGQ